MHGAAQQPRLRRGGCGTSAQAGAWGAQGKEPGPSTAEVRALQRCMPPHLQLHGWALVALRQPRQLELGLLEVALQVQLCE